MTGYGRGFSDVARGRSSVRLVVEARSVNHRGFDLKIRSDDPDARSDVEISKAVRAVVERGSVTVHVRTEGASAGLLDVDRIRDALAVLERIRREAGLAEPVDLATVAAFLGDAGGPAVDIAGDSDGEGTWRELRPAVETALADLVAMRAREGEALRTELADRMDGLQKLVEQLEAATKPIPARFARRLEERLVALRDVPGFEPGRVAQEIALMAERLDVTEEVLRLRTHIEHFRGLLDATAPVGRKLDFVIQEVGREINTVGSKAQDATVGALVIDGKAELEKIREQAQNIE